jgi:hypothetical protein
MLRMITLFHHPDVKLFNVVLGYPSAIFKIESSGNMYNRTDPPEGVIKKWNHE